MARSTNVALHIEQEKSYISSAAYDKSGIPFEIFVCFLVCAV
jgi:hypothetical protein